MEYHLPQASSERCKWYESCWPVLEVADGLIKVFFQNFHAVLLFGLCYGTRMLPQKEREAPPKA
jgi:hypothetical protein